MVDASVRGEDFYLATSGDIDLATREDFFMATDRLRTRSSNSYGKTAPEMARVLTDLKSVEPLLREVADVVIDTQRPLSDVTDTVLKVTALGLARERAGSVAAYDMGKRQKRLHRPRPLWTQDLAARGQSRG